MCTQHIKTWLRAAVVAAGVFWATCSSGAEALQIESIQPYYGDVAEDQAFILHFNQPVSQENILPYSYCQSSAVGEQIPLVALAAELAQALLEEQSYEYSTDTADEYIVAHCVQRLAPGSTVRLQLFNAAQQSLVPQAFTADKTGLSFTVRNPLRAQLFCDKTKSTADCNPLRPLYLRFSAPVSAHIAQELQLLLPDNTVLKPEELTEQDAFIDGLSFAAPSVPQVALRWQLPAEWQQLQDDAGRSLANPEFFQQSIKMATLPPLLKFAHEGIGVLERFVEEPALLPLAIRGVEPDLLTAQTKKSAGQLRQLRVNTPRDLFDWYVRVKKHHASDQSLFEKNNVTAQTQQLILPAAPSTQDKDIELIGVPLEGAGLHILEAQSAQLGKTYHEDSEAMYLSTATLVTNLAVHSKLSANQLLVWVSRLDTGKPVSNADITVLSCDGTLVASGRTDANGTWLDHQAFDEDYCAETGLSGLFITATTVDDSSFVLSNSDQGIESWRFNLPYFYGADQSEIAHTVTDRPLFLAGETVHLKHYWRGESSSGQHLNQRLPDLIIRHVGSGDEIAQKLQWQRSPTGGWYALSTLDLAKNTTLGQYNVWLEGQQHSFNSASFYVEAFKRPYLTGKVNVAGAANAPLVAAKEAVVDIQLNYISGGVAAAQPVQISALTQGSSPSFAAYDDYRFTSAVEAQRPAVVIDKTPLLLDEHGAAQLTFPLAPSAAVQDLVVEASFMDPNGQVQSLQQRQRLWPAEVVVGVNHPYWEQGNSVTVKGVVIDPSGQPLAQQTVKVSGQKQYYYTTRQRMVGGFYRYDSQEQLEELGSLCQAQTNTKGEWSCDVEVPDGGQLILHSSSTDTQGQTYTTETSLWLGGEETAVAGDNHDRIDVVAEKKTAAPGEKVRFQVTMPFAEATALVAVEQDKVLYTEVMTLKRDNPFFELTVQDDWGPNVYVSVLALRGRVYPATWQSFLDGGWKSPLEWYQAYKNKKELAPEPTSSIDLSKPSFRYGIAQLKVPNTAHAIQVTLQPAQAVYQPGQTAQLNVAATLASGEPAAHASLLLVGVDQALLELMENTSWDLLDAMYPAVGYGVRTATMQSEVIGKRHYGRKAVPAGGGGGGAPTREVLDSLLIWSPEVVLDAQGEAMIDMPLNHSITQFELVALVDSGGTQFGVAKAQIQTHQPVQIMSGLPAVVRTGDSYEAVFTVRNREKAPMTMALAAEASINGESVFNLVFEAQNIAAESSHTFKQVITMPAELGANEGQVLWALSARNQAADEVVDQLQFEQAWQAQIPVRTQQVVWQRLFADQPQAMSVPLPHGAMQYHNSYLGQVQLGVQQSLGDQSAVKTWFEQYPYTCFEQQASKYVALHDTGQWQNLMQELPSYLDKNNLLRYFPSPYLKGSAGLNAYVLSLSAYSPELTTLPPPLAQKLLQGLHDYVEGRRDQPYTSALEQVAFYLAALDALAQYQMLPPHRLDVIALEIAQWPTSALIDGLRVISDPTQRAQIDTELQRRLVSRGSALLFSDDNALNSMPALMVSPVTNQARLLLAVAQNPAWESQIPALVHGLLAQQHKGRWGTTTENSWALLALEQVDPPSNASMAVAYTVANAPQNEAKVPFTAAWDWEQNGIVHIEQKGTADTPPLWLQLRAEAAVPVWEPNFDGYEITRTVEAVEQAKVGQWQVGDIYEVTLTINAEHSSVWAVINDAIPAGAVVLDRVSQRQDDENTTLTPSYVERLYTGYRAYIEYLPAGKSTLRYQARLNTAGQFELPPTLVESLYDASVQAQLPVSDITIYAAP